MRHITFKIGMAERDCWLESISVAMEETAGSAAVGEFLDRLFTSVADFMRNQADR